MKPEKGQTLYSLNVGNSARGCAQELTEVEVTKVGRKYFTCTKKGWGFGTVYHINDWQQKTECTANSVLYEREQDWHDEKERDGLLREMSHLFSAYGDSSGVTLIQLRDISKILNK